MSKPTTLDGCRAKLARSEKHLNDVKAEYDARTAENVSPVELVLVEEIGHDGKLWAVLRCGEVTNPPPPEWGLMVGDAVHNARSALDHLACRLVDLEGGTVTNFTAFPIWDQDPRGDKDKEQRFERMLRGMAGKHKKGIRALQPYANPGSQEAAKLVTLAALDNLDKHQVILPAYATFTEPNDIVTYWSTPTPDHIDYRWNKNVLIKPGTEIVRWRTHSGQPVYLKGQFHLRSSFGDATTGLRELREIRSYCVAIIESFAPDFS